MVPSRSHRTRRLLLTLASVTLLGACTDDDEDASATTRGSGIAIDTVPGTPPPTPTLESEATTTSLVPAPTTSLVPAPTTIAVPANPGVPAAPAFETGPCPFDVSTMLVRVDCGTVRVAQNRSDPSVGVVTLAVMVVRTGTDSALTPIVYLPGGPGDSAVSTIAGLATDAEALPVFGGRDWVVFDPRGTGFSTPTVACPVTDEMTDVQQTAAAGVCASQLTASGVDLTTYNTSTLAADAIDVRTALAIDRWNLFGVSYGTRVALELMRQDPGAIDAATLDGVYPPTQGFNDSLDERPTAAFQQLFADCSANATCAAAFPDLEQRVVAMIERLNTSPLESAGFVFTGDFAIVVAARAMYHYSPGEDEIPAIPYALSTAADGDVAALTRLAELNFGDEGSSAGDAEADTTVGMGRAVQCHDEIPFLDRDLADEQSTEYPFGASFGRFDGNVEFDICALFDAGTADPSFRLPVVTDVPTLMFTGTYDPTTPTRWADEAASTMTVAQVARFEGVGHVVINTGACPVGLMHSFFAEPTSPLELSCVAEYTSPEFDLVAPE